MTVDFLTLGCKVNHCETQAIWEQFAAVGYDRFSSDSGDAPDVFVLNSCTVTAESDRKTRQAVRRTRKQYPFTVIALIGCMPQAFPDDVRMLIEADLVLGHVKDENLPEIVAEFLRDRKRIVAVTPHEPHEQLCGGTVTAAHRQGALRVRASVKIEDGCDRFCAYCIIPFARGGVRSKPLAAIADEVNALAEIGYLEVTLVGINLSDYGKELSLTLADAIGAAAGHGLRLRLGSLEPDRIDDGLLDMLADTPEFCPHFHLSLQSGCDRTLAAMNRHYAAADYQVLAGRIRARFPAAALTTDIMVGFPGETGSDFEDSLAFVQSIGFADAHVFPYSRRAGTPAATHPHQVSRAIKVERARRMQAAVTESKRAFFRSLVGKPVLVLAESVRPDGLYGYSESYTPVCFAGNADQIGQLVPVRITDAVEDACIGEVM